MEASAAFSTLAKLTRGDPEALERVWAEGGRDRDVRGIPTASDEHAANSGRVVARVEGVPAAAEVDFKPGGEVHRRIRWWHTDVSEVARAIAGGNVHAATERHCQMREIPADTLALIEYFPGRFGRVRVLVSKLDVSMHEITDRLNASPAAGCP